MTRDVALPDGRTLGIEESGVPGGTPLLFLHGTPGSRYAGQRDPGLPARLGIHRVAFDRPGYGRSTRDEHRTVRSVGEDAVALADALGWERFLVHGVSGGGPHALAVAVAAPERVIRVCACVPGTPQHWSPPDDPNLLAVNREARKAASEGRDALVAFLQPLAAGLAEDPAGALDRAMADAPEADRALLADPVVRDRMARSLAEGFVNGPDGWFDDAWALATDWGFEPADVEVPVDVWFGELDRNCPPAIVDRYRSELRDARVEMLPGTGHLGWLLHEERVLSRLL